MYARRRFAALRNPTALAKPALTVRGEGVRRLRRLTHAADGFADLPPPPFLTYQLKDGANHLMLYVVLGSFEVCRLG